MPAAARRPHHAHHRARAGAHLPRPSTFDLCVANHETGEPNGPPWLASTVHWQDTPEQNEGLYWGAYSWMQGTWEAQGGTRYAEHASEATPRQQSAVFNDAIARGEGGQWPNTVPPCMAYR